LICGFHWCLEFIDEDLCDIYSGDGVVNAGIDALGFEMHDGRWGFLEVLLVDQEVDHVRVEALTAA
jgi:hypothetical protein